MTVEAKIDVQRHLEEVNSSALWTLAASEWHRLYRPYVPFQEGILYSTVNITAENGAGIIEHTVPYAHYIYEGEIYGKNIPIRENGVIVGWYSADDPKHPTGRMMQYHGTGCRHWDEAAAPTQLPVLISELQQAIDNGLLNLQRGSS